MNLEWASPHPDEVQILLVEDNPGDAELVQTLLQRNTGVVYRTQHVSRLGDAVVALTERPIDVVLLDLGLPDATGDEVVSRLHIVNPHLPIVVLTGNDNDHVQQSSIRAGADDFIGKNNLTAIGLRRCLQSAIERRRMQEQLRALVAEIADAIVIVGEEGTIRFVNPAAVAMFGRSEAHLVGKRFEYPIRIGEETEVEFDGVDGSAVTAAIRATTVTWQGQGAIVASICDITDRKRKEALQVRLMRASKLASIGQLSACLAHEINNPATYVQSNLEVMKEYRETLVDAVAELRAVAAVKRQSAWVEEIIERRGLLTMLDDMAALNRDNLHGMRRIVAFVKELKAAHSRVERTEFEFIDVTELVRSACEFIRGDARERARIEQKIVPVPQIVGHRDMLSQAVVKLLVNAVQSIGEGDSEQNSICVETAVIGGHIAIAISDTGCGIPDDLRDRIFEPFFTTKPQTLGTGLSLTADAVHKHGGTIEVDSAVGRGSCFTIKLPIESHLAPAADKVEHRADNREPQRARVLLVDDDTLVRKALRRTLENKHDVLDCASGEEALAELARHPLFDLILCDLRMPDMDGPGLYERLTPDARSRLVFISGGAFTPENKAFVSKSGVRVLDKPITPAELDQVIAETLAKANRPQRDR
ncbi:MAG: response regulator [Proteobacteria bacterium]|nr:response regulator [Pseudomonadota bacterium]